MGYCTQTDIEYSKYSEILKSTGGNGSAITAEIITQAIAFADGEIDFHVCNQYDTPLSSPPQIIKTMSVRLAIDWLYRRSNIENKSARTDADKVYKMLQEIRDGKQNIPDLTKKSSSAAVIQPFEGSDLGEYTAPLFHMGTLE